MSISPCQSSIRKENPTKTNTIYSTTSTTVRSAVWGGCSVVAVAVYSTGTRTVVPAVNFFFFFSAL